MLFPRSLRPARRTRRRVFEPAGIVVGTILGAAALTGVTAAAASAYGESAPMPSPAAITVAWSADSAGPSALSSRGIAAAAQTTLTAAKDAVAEAERLTADIAAAGLDIGYVDTSVDTSELTEQIERLEDTGSVPIMLLPTIGEATATETQRVSARTTTLRAALTATQERKAAEHAAAAAAALAAANTPQGAMATAQELSAAQYGWGSDQFSCLVKLWHRESNWNHQAYNAGSGATGIPQALPGSKMASAGADWQTNATTQIRWGLDYISRGYGSPCSAWGHSNATGWY